MDTILSGMRPTGRLHLGHLHGALKNWVRLQEGYRCFFFVADWHALTTDYASPQGIEQNTVEMVMDWLSVGLDPRRSVLFRQSRIKEHAELHLLLSMITPVSWLERNPTYKEQMRELEGRDLSTYAFWDIPCSRLRISRCTRPTRSRWVWTRPPMSSSHEKSCAALTRFIALSFRSRRSFSRKPRSFPAWTAER